MTRTIENRAYGVDVSSFNNANTTEYTNAGADFVLVKVSEGLDYRNPKAKAQVDSAKQNNVVPMAYHYARFSGNSNVAVQEGNYAVSSAKLVGIEPGSYLACDYEQGSGNETGGNSEDNTTAILKFLDTIVSAGYKPLLYSGAALMKNKINAARILEKYPNCLWVAAYPYKGATNTADFNYFPSMEGVAIWQFTDNWRGMDVDGNINLLELETNSSVSQPVKVPVESTSWIDTFGDKWVKEDGTFITDRPINLRKGAKLTSNIITTLPAGSVIKYDAYSRHDGYVWIRQPREDDQYGYLVCRQRNIPWGTFK
ncbi:putative phage lysin [Lactobacillus johnsonii DPC 6026]|uniref:GH25 family lysozyme n=1 Tax=Lactobacillus johnsonii TaxID=33959 RepID=UPI000207C062|nr:GH25 family lysozyme [Lactobacillus johnsonii]AEB93145.1 putative phage lysin [Lactobacillus johnsonii DPC 6026]